MPIKHFDGGGKSQIWLTKKGNVLFDGLTFQNDFSAKDNGGALVFNGTGVTGKVVDCSFIGNKVTDGTNSTQYLSGGAIHVFEAKVTVENSSFSKNYGRNGASFDSSKGYWKWNGTSASFTKAKEADIVTRLKAIDSNNGNTRLNGQFATEFVEWVESLGDFNKDQLGTTRTTSGTWPGSVELK